MGGPAGVARFEGAWARHDRAAAPCAAHPQRRVDEEGEKGRRLVVAGIHRKGRSPGLPYSSASPTPLAESPSFWELVFHRRAGLAFLCRPRRSMRRWPRSEQKDRRRSSAALAPRRRPRALRHAHVAPADLRTQMHLSREGMHFYLSSLLGGKIHQQFAYPIGDRNHNAQYQFVKQKCKCILTGISLMLDL
jgi:hypothetical protein